MTLYEGLGLTLDTHKHVLSLTDMVVQVTAGRIVKNCAQSPSSSDILQSLASNSFTKLLWNAFEHRSDPALRVSAHTSTILWVAPTLSGNDASQDLASGYPLLLYRCRKSPPTGPRSQKCSRPRRQQQAQLRAIPSSTATSIIRAPHVR